MDFHLEFTPQPLKNMLTHKHRLMLMGSCFTENIGDKLMAAKFTVLQNPNGILFNPVSVAEAIDNYITNKHVGETSLFHFNEGYHSWQHHSRFSSPVKADAIERINTATNGAHHYLKTADALIITFGSAWVYELTNAAANANVGKVAANNHKAPASWFSRRLLRPDELNEVIGKMIKMLLVFNPRLQIIFTISPVRHLREGFVENNRSKAALITAIHSCIAAHEQSYYFPAYELVIDDLRDYRFYAEDLVHPNYAATNYVWKKFIAACIDEPSQQLMKNISELNAARQHKAFNPGSEAHRKFMEISMQKLSELIKKYPHINFSEEAAYFSGSMS